MTVLDQARTDVVTADPQTPIGELASTMATEEIGSIVITETEFPVGIVTDRDIAIRAFAGGGGDGLVASDVMTADPLTIDADAGLMELTNLMGNKGIRRVPVVDDGRLAGIVTLDDVTVLLATELANVARVVLDESPPY